MKKDAALTLWALSFIAMVVLAENPYNISFWISLGIFGYLSITKNKYIKKAGIMPAL